MSAINNGGPAFPPSVAEIQGRATTSDEFGMPGLSLRDYFAAHAPRDPQPWFQPDWLPKPEPVYSHTHPESCGGECSPDNWEERKNWHGAHERQRLVQWPYAWADAQLKAREVQP